MTDTEIVAAIRNLLGGAAPPDTPVAVVRWWDPTDAIAAAFAKRIGWSTHDLWGNRQANGSATDPLIAAISGVREIPTASGSPRQFDVSPEGEAQALLYASFGFDPTGARVLWHSDNREQTLKLIYRLAAVKTGAEANDILDGAGYCSLDCVACLLLTNHVTGGGLMGTPRVGFAGATTVAAFVAASFAMTTRKPGDPGPGIAG